MFTNAADIKNYARAGHATLTLQSARTGGHYTFKVDQLKERDGTTKPMWFVGLLTGPDNYADYSYIGIINEAGEFRTTAKSKLPADSKPVRGFAFFWKFLMQDQIAPEMEIRHEGTCGRCGHKLTVPESIDSGLGPDCRQLMGL